MMVWSVSYSVNEGVVNIYTKKIPIVVEAPGATGL